jgi:Zn-dependent protease
MGWQDRPYYRDQGPTPRNPLLWLFTGSVPLFTAFGIRVRMHASMLVLLGFGLLGGVLSQGLALAYTITGWSLLFGIILLHEFGHCFAARWVGGDANEILIWPLGGLAFADAPRRPWPQFVTVAGGPAVNLIICGVTAAIAWLLMRNHPQIIINPLTNKLEIPAVFTVSYYLWWTYAISWWLFWFNLLPIYPMDGGRLLQTLLWVKIGFYRATMITMVVGMVGSVLMALYGLLHFGTWFGLILIILGANCFLNCFLQRAQLKAEGPWAFEEENADYSAAMWHPDDDEPRPKRKRLSRRAVRKLRRQAQAEEAEQARIDAILAKVSAHGMQSLSWRERRALRKATERRRREMELTRESD